MRLLLWDLPLIPFTMTGPTESKSFIYLWNDISYNVTLVKIGKYVLKVSNAKKHLSQFFPECTIGL